VAPEKRLVVVGVRTSLERSHSCRDEVAS
jgi:hypothetical protein